MKQYVIIDLDYYASEAQSILNEKAKEGWRLHTLTTKFEGCLQAVLEREVNSEKTTQ